MTQECWVNPGYTTVWRSLHFPAMETRCVFLETQPTPLRIHLQAPFHETNLTQAMQDFNKSMSLVRVSVEWLFGDIANYFKCLDFKKNLKIGLSQIGKKYIVCAILRNSGGRYYEYRFRYDTCYFFIDTTVSIPLSIPILCTMKSANAYFYLCYKQEV